MAPEHDEKRIGRFSSCSGEFHSAPAIWNPDLNRSDLCVAYLQIPNFVRAFVTRFKIIGYAKI
jgi:hypothetical protein